MKNGGKRPGAGRPRGKKAPATLERLKVLEAYRQRGMKLADKLLDAQLHLTQVRSFLYKIEKKLVVGPKGGKSYIPQKPKLVESELEIREWLEGRLKLADVDDPESLNNPGATYYYVTTKDPELKAATDILDRTFGTAVQSTKLVDDNEKSIPIVAVGGMSEAQLDEYLATKLTRSSDKKGFK